MTGGNFHNHESGTRETVKPLGVKPGGKPHGTKIKRMQQYTAMRKLMEQYRVGFDYIAATSGDALGSCHNALNPDKFMSVNYGATVRIRWAVEQLLQDRGFTDVAQLPALWAEYDQLALADLIQPGPEAA